MALTGPDGEDLERLHRFVFGVEDGPTGPRFACGVAEYFQFLSACGPLEDETFRAICSRRRRPHRFATACCRPRQ